MTQSSYIKKCPECESINLNTEKEKGHIVCRDCGLVIEEKLIDFSQEWREFEDKASSRRRTGQALTFTKYDRGLGTSIGQTGDIYQLDGANRDKFFRLRKWQYRVSTAIERNLKLALAELKRVS